MDQLVRPLPGCQASFAFEGCCLIFVCENCAVLAALLLEAGAFVRPLKMVDALNDLLFRALRFALARLVARRLVSLDDRRKCLE